MAKVRCITIPLPSPRPLPRPSQRTPLDSVLKVFHEGLRLKSLHSRLVPRRKAKSAWTSPAASPKSRETGTDTGLDVWAGKAKQKLRRQLRTAGESRKTLLWRANRDEKFGEGEGWSPMTTLFYPDLAIVPKTSISHVEELYSTQRQTHVRDKKLSVTSNIKPVNKLLSPTATGSNFHQKSLRSQRKSPQLPRNPCEEALFRDSSKFQNLWEYRSPPQAFCIFDSPPVLPHKAQSPPRQGRKSEPRGT